MTYCAHLNSLLLAEGVTPIIMAEMRVHRISE